MGSGQVDDVAEPRRVLFSWSITIGNDQVADGEAVAQSVAFTEGFEFFDDLPHIGLGYRGRDRYKPGDGLAVLGDCEFLV